MRTARCCSAAAIPPPSNPATGSPFKAPFTRTWCRRRCGASARLRIWMSRGEMRETLASIRKQLDSQQGMQIKRMRGFFAGITLPLLVLGLAGAWFIARQLSAAHLRPGEERRPDRPGRLHAASRRGAPRRARRPAIRARAHAAEIERNHHHQELSQHGAQQPERCRVGDLARRHREELQRGRPTAARLPGGRFARQAPGQLHR